jgi:hypothetical protein
MPVPGALTVSWWPRALMLVVKPWPPIEAEMPLRLAFKPEAREEFDAFTEAEAHRGIKLRRSYPSLFGNDPSFRRNRSHRTKFSHEGVQASRR